MRRTGLNGRLEQIEGTRRHVTNEALLRTIAEDEGISEGELIAEMERMTAICQGQGIRSMDGMVRYWADDLGITLEELEQRMERYRELVP